MKIHTRHMVFGLFAAFAAQSAMADLLPIAPLEGSVESTASEVSLPVAENGIVTARACPTCETRTFYLDKQHRLLLNGRSVSLAEMTKALRSAGDTPVAVHYKVSDSLITRIVMMVQAK